MLAPHPESDRASMLVLGAVCVLSVSAVLAPGTVPPLPGIPAVVDTPREGDEQEFARWWFKNGERVLDVRRRLAAAQAARGSAGWRGASRVSAASRDAIVNALLDALANRRTDAVVEAPACIALGKAKDARAVGPLLERLADGDAAVRRHAAFALGILDDSQGAARLVAALQDASNDRAARVDAALGLGLATDAETCGALARLLDEKALLALDPPLANAVLLAAGARADDAIAASIAHLVERRARLRLDQRTEGFLALAFAHRAKLTDLDRLTGLLADGDNRFVRRAAAIGFGVVLDRAADSGRDQARKLVDRVFAGPNPESDVVARALSLASLGRIGGAGVAAWLARRFDPEPRPTGPYVLPHAIHLQRQIVSDPFTAFALGATGEAGPGDSWRTLLGKKFDDEPALDARSAIALGIGLQHGGDAGAKRIVRELRSTKNRDFAGLLALACGLAGAESAVEPIEDLIERRSGGDANVVPCAAVALALLGDGGVEAKLLARLAAQNASGPELASVLLALGLIGDDACVPAIVKLLADDRANAQVRAAAALALGELVDPDADRRTARYRVDHDDSLDPEEWRPGGFLLIL